MGNTEPPTLLGKLAGTIKAAGIAALKLEQLLSTAAFAVGMVGFVTSFCLKKVQHYTVCLGAVFLLCLALPLGTLLGLIAIPTLWSSETRLFF